MDKRLHIVCLDVPYPPDYGGVFEMFYKIKALHEEGIKIILHVFEYGRGQGNELHQYCEEVFYYDRIQGHKGVSMSLPYIVSSRANPQLLKNLEKDNYPVLLEGIHTTYFLQQGKLCNRKVVLRLHNAEYLYYKLIAAHTRSLFKKIYYYNECRRLYRYEKEIAAKCLILALNEQEANVYRKEFSARNVALLPAFIGWNIPLCREGIGTFCLYHGNLSVAENERAAEWLMKHVFNDLEIPFVIAGKNPSSKLETLAQRNTHTCLVANPSEKEMQDLIQKAQLNVLPAFGSTGIKFKLLNAVFCGRHCVGNDLMTSGTNLESACHIASNAKAFKSILLQLYRRPFEEEEIELRRGLMHSFYNNRVNAQRLIQWIW